ncbi:MAG: tRNA threonylcarbamoyladenosine biosynthesis protein TsaB [Actinomycetota bacterium]|nr:tRNA threonylcarbamoyladenosine biosynthesis protein TsaB [Actinomycetota bacterium]
MLLLALDTSGATVTAALHDGTSVIAERAVTNARRHAELLAPAIAAVLDDAGRDRTEITDIVVGVGPGPFTGLRVGVVTARVLGAALGVPVHGVCSLDGIAEDVSGTGDFLVATDARRREVYWAAYHRDADGAPPERRDGPHVSRPAEVPVAGRPVTGRGATLYPDDLGPAGEPFDVRAGALAALAARSLAGSGTAPTPVTLCSSEPMYLRRPDATPPGARKRVLT